MHNTIELHRKDFEQAWWQVVCCLFQVDQDSAHISVDRAAIKSLKGE